MARINIDDSIYRDSRFFELTLKLGSFEAAMGALVMAWSLGQKWYIKSENGMIPIQKWQDQKIKTEIIDCGLARVRGDFIYVCGARKHFEWIKKCSEAGKSRSEDKTKHLKQNTEGTFGEGPKGDEGSPKGPEGSPKVTEAPFSLLLNNTNNNIISRTKVLDHETQYPLVYQEIISILSDRKVTVKVATAWCDVFVDPSWVVEKIKAANIYLISKPKKEASTKNFGLFFTNWLNNAKSGKYNFKNKKNEERQSNNRAALDAALKKLEGNKENET